MKRLIILLMVQAAFCSSEEFSSSSVVKQVQVMSIEAAVYPQAINVNKQFSSLKYA